MQKIKLALFFKVVGIYWSALSLLFLIGLLFFFALFGKILSFTFIKTGIICLFIASPGIFSFMIMNLLISVTRHCSVCGADLNIMKKKIEFSQKNGKPKVWGINFKCSKVPGHPNDGIDVEDFLLWGQNSIEEE